MIALVVGCVLSLAAQTGAATTEWVVSDPNTGLAISGFDPVAYFINGAPSLGKEELEYAYAGTVWRFVSNGNRAAFMADPDVYMPRFGGYDPTGVARGLAVAGNPTIWIVIGQRLYLFRTAAGREEFAGDSDQILATADRTWPELRLHELVP